MAWSSEGTRLTLFLIIDLISTAVGENVNSTNSGSDQVKWEVSEFGICSFACGGGIQVRTVHCVRTSQQYGRGKEIQVPDALCPSPAPAMTQSCNSQACTGYWVMGNWSQCSLTCGKGTQIREVTCQRSPRLGHRYHVAHAECGGLAPVSTRNCHVTDCPFRKTAILSENYTLIQLHKTKKIKVNVGGQVNLLPGQTIVVKCPVKNFPKKVIYWSKGYRLVHLMGRIRGTPRGLYIDEGDPKTDAGVYTCIAGDLTSTVTVTFIKKNDTSRIMYKQWMKHTQKSQKYQNYKYKKHGHKNNSIWTLASENHTEETNQQRDQSHNSSHVLIFVASDWSPCSAACGEAGYKKRKVSCSHLTPKYVKIVADSECEAIGLIKPQAVEECSAEKPCAKWYPGPWSECLPSCGEAGHMTRLLSCEWESTGQPAGAACDLSNRPSVSKPCQIKPCPLECIDSSPYCGLAGLLKLCRFYHFRSQCCLTCERWSNATS